MAPMAAKLAKKVPPTLTTYKKTSWDLADQAAFLKKVEETFPRDFWKAFPATNKLQVDEMAINIIGDPTIPRATKAIP